MRILYGVVGEGMGHAVRSKVLLEYLVSQGHEILIVVSARAHRYLTEQFAGCPKVRVEEIKGLHLSYEGNALALPESVALNLENLPRNLATGLEVYRRVVESHARPQAVISDFEYWAYAYGLRHRVPVISVDNIQMIDRCSHDPAVLAGSRLDYRLARAVVRVKLPRAYHYLITSFFFPLIRKPRTTLVPPILRREVLESRREPGGHVLVYQTASANQALVPTLRKLPVPFRVYGMGRVGEEGNVRLCPFSEAGFLEDLRTARAAISGGSFTLMGEAVHLGVPLLSVPVEGQFEQVLNARYLAQLGYGGHSRKLDAAQIERFLARTGDYTQGLDSFPRQDNRFLYRCLDELLWRIRRGDPPPAALSMPGIGQPPQPE